MLKIIKKFFIYVFICELCLNFITTAYAGKVYNAVLSNNWDDLINTVYSDPKSVDDMDSYASTAVMKAIEIDNLPMLIFLIDNGADINARYDNGRTVLMQITYNYRYNEYDKVNLVDYLIRMGANINIRDYDGSTALIYAAMHGNMSVIELLLKDWGANINDRNYCGWTSLMIAISLNYGFIARFLIKNKNVNINAKNCNGNNALMLAVIFSGLDMVKLFFDDIDNTKIKNVGIPMNKSVVKNKININAKNKKGYNALMLASKNGKSDIVNFLISKKADIDAQNNDGDSALMLAFKYKKIDVIKILMEKRANLEIRNHKGLNVLDIARENNMMNLFEILPKNKKPQIDKPIRKIKKHKKVRKKTNADKDDKSNKK
ncbi:MAG: ankyrin repeat domain-containing protein [Clostridia bacterium]|nr:ankyrin repeat domain-containing protein [Clostridia bacterium]